MTVIDEQLKEYLDLKFSAVIEEIKVTTKENTANISANERQIDKILSYISEHQRVHETKENKNQWNISQWVAVILVIAAIMSDKFL